MSWNNPACRPRWAPVTLRVLPDWAESPQVHVPSDEARWDQALERLSVAEKTTEFGVLDTPTRESEVYWAAMFLSIAAYQARVRTSTRLNEKVRHV